jgi:hypothetical protein
VVRRSLPVLLVLALPATAAAQDAEPPAAEPVVLTAQAPKALATGVPIPVSGDGATPGARLVLERRSGTRWLAAKRFTARSNGRFDVTYATRVVAPRFALRVREGDAASPTVRTEVRDVTFAAVGDVNLGDVPGAQIARYGTAWPWASVGPVLRAADVAMANVECAVSTRGAPVQKQFRFRGTPAALAATAKVGGIDVANLANNHVGDYGTLALRDTIANARRSGMGVSGAGYTLGAALQPAVVERLGLRIAVVGFSNILPYEFAASATKPGVAWATPEHVRAAVRAAREKADVVVATFHWGIEKDRVENGDQRALAQVAFDAGATAVIGAHPHVLQPMRRVGAHRFVAYSLGNFVFGAGSPGTTSTGILTLSLSARGVEGSTFRRARIVAGRPIL